MLPQVKEATAGVGAQQGVSAVSKQRGRTRVVVWVKAPRVTSTDERHALRGKGVRSRFVGPMLQKEQRKSKEDWERGMGMEIRSITERRGGRGEKACGNEAWHAVMLQGVYDSLATTHNRDGLRHH